LFSDTNIIELMKQPFRILIADDNQAVLQSLEYLLEDYFEEVVILSNPNQILSEIQKRKFDVFLLDMNFSAGINTGNEGLFWFNQIRKAQSDALVVFLTAYGDVELAVKSVKKGAFDFIIKPWNNAKLTKILLNAARSNSGKKKFENDRVSKSRAEIFVQEKSESMQHIQNTINKVSKTDVSILLLGENGTGKEVLSRKIHKQSSRKHKQFVQVDVNALNENILESELFGHVKGAFSGAEKERKGKFEEADGGTLFLDEIGNLSLEAQSKLLTVLQRKVITPLGSNNEVPIDIRLICATNENLQQMTEEGRFRQDLYFRINTMIIEIPPLRNRKKDILAYINFFLKHFADKYRKPEFKLSETAKRKLMEYPWPGNIRELKHLMERTIILSDKAFLKPEDLFLKPILTLVVVKTCPTEKLQKL